MDKQAIVLCRVSTKQQMDDGNLASQVKRVDIAAEYLKAEIIKRWEIAASSRKGKNVKRKDLLEMQDVCRRNKKIKYLIVDEVDRFMRSIDEYYYWKVQFKILGVQLIHADNPSIDPNDPVSVFNELIKIYQAEQSNNERITKTPEKQMSKMRAGYYTFAPLPGYKLSETPSLHVIDTERFYLLQRAFKAVANNVLTPNEALKRMTSEGYRTKNGCKMDMARFKQIMVKPYYSGIIQVSNWPVASENGLHEHMISKAEHESLKIIALGKKKKFAVNKKNPMFPLNETTCIDCQNESIEGGKITGYRNHNGKIVKTTGEKHYYYRYRCRGCKTYFTRNELHDLISIKLESIELDDVSSPVLVQELQKVWRSQIATNANKIAQLNARKISIEASQSSLAVTYATTENEVVKDATLKALNTKDIDLMAVKDEIIKLSNIDSEMESFIEYSIGYTQRLKEKYWSLNWEKRKRCEQLLFPDGIYVNRQKKVYTPTISPIYRSKGKQKESVKTLELSYGGRYTNKFAPMLDEIIRWRGIIGKEYSKNIVDVTAAISNSIP